MEKRIWIRSGVVEELDKRQLALLALVGEKIEHYYRRLYRTRPCYQYPLSLSQLMRLCNRNSYAVSLALRILANTRPLNSREMPSITYHRVKAEKNASHRPYRILLRRSKE